MALGRAVTPACSSVAPHSADIEMNHSIPVESWYCEYCTNFWSLNRTYRKILSIMNPPKSLAFITAGFAFCANATIAQSAPGRTVLPIEESLCETTRVHEVRKATQPTCAVLKSGRNHQVNSMAGTIETGTALHGNTGQIPKNAALLAEMLRPNGFATAAFSKWHETAAWEARVAGDFDCWPRRQSFDKFYGFLGGVTKHWGPSSTTSKSPKANSPPPSR
jgi:hypothetical protein